MIAVTMVPMDAETAAGRCWLCKYRFVTDDYYCRLSLPCGDRRAIWSTCLGCAALLLCRTNQGDHA